MDLKLDVTREPWLVNRVQQHTHSNDRTTEIKLIKLTVETRKLRKPFVPQDTERPERRTALVSKELAKFNTDITTFSETRLSRKRKTEEMGSNYTFWKRKERERKAHGVTFALKSKLVTEHHLKPSATNRQLMALRIPISATIFMTLMSAYAPTFDASDNVKITYCNVNSKEGDRNCNEITLAFWAVRWTFFLHHQYSISTRKSFQATWKLSKVKILTPPGLLHHPATRRKKRTHHADYKQHWRLLDRLSFTHHLSLNNV